jgi:diadenosine tetraphosphate (Ap4A) HIT family hydrolase
VGVALVELGTVAAIADSFPVAKGHVLVIPRRHVESYFEFTETEVTDAWRLLNLLRQRLTSEHPDIQGFNVGVNDGDAAGQTISHAHIHLIPRRRGDAPDPRGGVRGVIPDRMAY